MKYVHITIYELETAYRTLIGIRNNLVVVDELNGSHRSPVIDVIEGSMNSVLEEISHQFGLEQKFRVRNQYESLHQFS